ncbi:MAG: tetratricopeptide repeat protein [Gammaproteobacteria bacterium]
MSLINDMLKDLDSQRTHPNVAHASALRGLGLAGPVNHTKHYAAPLLYTGALVLVILLVLPWILQLVRHPAASWTATLPIPEQATHTARVLPAVTTAEEAAQSAIAVAAAPAEPSEPLEPSAAATATVDAAVSNPQQAAAEQHDSAPVPAEPVAAQAQLELPAVTESLQAADQRIEIFERPLTPEQQQQHAYHNAVNTLRTGNLADAARQFLQVLALNSGHQQARLMLANIYLKQQQHAEAETLLATGLAQDPRHAPFAMLYAQLLLAQQREQEAIQSLQTALPGAGQDAEYHAFLAALYQRNGKPAAAARLYEAALSQAPLKGEWWMGLGISQEQSGKLPAAYAAYQRALQYPLKPVLQQYIQARLKILAR